MATIHVSQIQRLRCYLEPNGSLGVDHSGTLGDYFDVPAIEGSVELKLEQPMIDGKYLRQNRDSHATEILGLKKAQLTFQIPFFFPTARSVAGVSPVAIVDSPTTKLLGNWLGGHVLGTSMDADASCTVSLIKTADYANAAEGCGIAWADTSGIMYARRIVKKSTTDLTLDQALPSAPVAADYIYRGVDLYLANRTTANVTTFQFLCEGADSSYDCYLLKGGQCITPPTLECKVGERPMWKFTIDFPSWAQKTSLATAGIVTYSNVIEHMVSDGIFTAWAIDSANPAVPVAIKTGLNAAELSFEFTNSQYIQVRSPGGVGTIAAYVMGGESPKIKGKWRMPLEASDVTWWGYRDAQSLIALNLQIGSSESTGCALITVPTAQIVDWQEVRSNGIVEQEISWVGQLDCMHDTSTSTATELSNAPFKIFVF